MIKSFEELGEVLAEFENRIGRLENSQSIPLREDKPQVIEHIHRHSDMSKKEFDLLQQTAGKVKYLTQQLDKKVKEMTNTRMVDKQSKYTISK